MLFVTVFSTLFFITDAAQEMLRNSSPLLADAALAVTDQEYENICQNPRVLETGSGIRIGITRDATGAGTQLFDFDENMAQWMRFYPIKGHMPESVNEIVVLISDAFYRSTCLELERRGIAPEDATYRMAGIVFASRGNTRRLMSQLISEEGLSLEEGEVFLNDISVFDGLEPGIVIALLFLLLVLMAIGYLFISNIFRICMPADARFYGRLSTNGVTKKEIRALIRRQNRILFLIAVLPALPAGYIFSCTALPGILNGYTTLHVKQSANPLIFILSLAFS